MKLFKAVVVLFFLVDAVIVAGIFYFVHDINKPLPDLKKAKVLVVEKGDGVNQVAFKLKDQDILEQTFNFETLLWLRKQENKLQAGEYKLNPGISAKELANTLVAGNTLLQEIQITIPEGFTSKDIEKRLVEKELSSQDTFTNAIKNYRYDFSGQEDYGKTLPSLEGYLFPDTYKFYKGASIQEIINKILTNFDKKLATDLRDEIKSQGKTIHEIIIMASIIEKEVRNVDEMKKVASVFYNRLAIDMPLESDATVNYATGKSRRQATYDDIKIDSLYNTYLYKGLPAGPISNPGLNAIRAAIYPEKTDYYYFLSPENGSTVFSKTLEEHSLAKAKYLGN